MRKRSGSSARGVLASNIATSRSVMSRSSRRAFLASAFACCYTTWNHRCLRRRESAKEHQRLNAGEDDSARSCFFTWSGYFGVNCARS
jgi:hypothetical protein